MKLIYIIRGLPGAGKSTLAHRLTDAVFEADMYFTKDGIYNYDRERIREAHDWCQNNTIDAMMSEYPVIAVSNTFVKRWEMEFYYLKAKEFGYQVVEITLTGKLHDNIHNVPPATIYRMQQGWEV